MDNYYLNFLVNQPPQEYPSNLEGFDFMPTNKVMPAAYGLLRYVNAETNFTKPAAPPKQCSLTLEDGQWKMLALAPGPSRRSLFKKMYPEIRFNTLNTLLTNLNFYVPINRDGRPVICSITDPAVAEHNDLLDDPELRHEFTEILLKNNTFCADPHGAKLFLRASPIRLQKWMPPVKVAPLVRSFKLVVPCWDMEQELVDGKNIMRDAVSELYSLSLLIMDLPNLKKLEVIICLEDTPNFRQEFTAKIIVLLHCIVELRKKGVISRVTLRHYEHEPHMPEPNLISSMEANHDANPNDQACSGSEMDVDDPPAAAAADEDDDDSDEDIDTVSITDDIECTRVRKGITFPTLNDYTKNVFVFWQKNHLRPHAVNRWVYSDVDVAWWFGKQSLAHWLTFTNTEHPFPDLWHYGYWEVQGLISSKGYPTVKLTEAGLENVLRYIENASPDSPESWVR